MNSRRVDYHQIQVMLRFRIAIRSAAAPVAIRQKHPSYPARRQGPDFQWCRFAAADFLIRRTSLMARQRGQDRSSPPLQESDLKRHEASVVRRVVVAV
jgi:hypothetical protein